MYFTPYSRLLQTLSSLVFTSTFQDQIFVCLALVKSIQSFMTFVARSRKNMSTGENDSGCLSLIRKALEKQDFSSKAAEIIDAWRLSTRKQYEGYSQKWLEFSSEREINPTNPTTPQVIYYLTSFRFRIET